MNIYTSLDQLVGRTPLIMLSRYAAEAGAGARLAGKLEMLNPSGSVKDRAALSMILAAEAEGKLRPGSVIVEPTSGNTGIALSWIAAVRGYRAILVMPDSMSEERRALMRAYGAELVLTPGKQGMKGAIEKASALTRELSAFMPSQFENPANPRAHLEATGPEIWRDTDGLVDALVCGVGTGGTISGAGRYLKSMNPKIQVIAAEPDASPVLSGGDAGPHPLQGIGAGFVPQTLDTTVFDRVVRVPGADALAVCHLLVRTEGLLCGVSSGAALWAATQLAMEPAFEGKLICVVLPDTGDRYLSTPGYV